MAVRRTRSEIDKLVTMAGKGTLDSQDSDSSTGGSWGRRDTPAPRPPVYPPPQRPPPPLPQGNPPRAAQETDRDGDPLFTVSVKKETQGAGERRFAPKDRPHQPLPCMIAPTEVPGFNPEADPAGPDLAGANEKGKGLPDIQGTGFLPGASSGDAGGKEGRSAEGTAGTGMGLGHAVMDHNGMRP